MAVKLGKQPQEAEIPTASMADIAFLLIIYFMVTSVFSSTRGMEFDLPKEEDKPQVQQEESIYIQVKANGSILVDGRPMEVSNLLDYVVPKLRVNQRKPVIIHPDGEAPYQDMIRVYDELMGSAQKTGFEITTVVIPTQREIQEYIDLFGYNPFATAGG
jgi:biopolymer transport protein ExbD